MLVKFQEKKLLKNRGKQRTDSTQVIAAIRQVNRLELAGETFRAALNEIAEVEPEWLKAIISEDWFERYSKRFDNYRVPRNIKKNMDSTVHIYRKRIGVAKPRPYGITAKFDLY